MHVIILIDSTTQGEKIAGMAIVVWECWGRLSLRSGQRDTLAVKCQEMYMYICLQLLGKSVGTYILLLYISMYIYIYVYICISLCVFVCLD